MKFGSKKIYLPNFTLALIRTTHLPPNFAQFIVPLNINKLDLKDYLYNAYGVECLSVRSYIEQQKIEYAKPTVGGRRLEWYRPRAIKKMTVELKEPFVYPEEPDDLSPWNHEAAEVTRKGQEKYRATYSEDAKKRPSPIRARLRQQAAEFLAKSHTDRFEVEKDIDA